MDVNQNTEKSHDFSQNQIKILPCSVLVYIFHRMHCLQCYWLSIYALSFASCSYVISINYPLPLNFIIYVLKHSREINQRDFSIIYLKSSYPSKKRPIQYLLNLLFYRVKGGFYLQSKAHHKQFQKNVYSLENVRGKKIRWKNQALPP
jgi:hypothetical protein